VRHALTVPFHATFWIFPELTEYSMNDLYSKHPTKPNLWLYVGRTDDVIVLSDREKFSLTAMEATLREHPSVKGALVVSQA
jgi:acyl-coenzyme A synthetase/AMP-(fatty) acid ligase